MTAGTLKRYCWSCSFEKIAKIQQLLFFWENCRDTAAPVLLRKLQIYSSFCSVEKIAKIQRLLFCWENCKETAAPVEKIAKIQRLLFCWEKLLVSPSLKACDALHYSWQQRSLTLNTHTRRLAWRRHGQVAQTPSSGLRGYVFEPQFRLTFFPLRLVVVWLVQWRRLPPQPSLNVTGAVTQTPPSPPLPPPSLVLVWLVQWFGLPPQPRLSMTGAVTQTSPSDFPLSLVLVWLVQWCGQPGSQRGGHVPVS